MQKLLTLFGKERNALQAEIDKATSLGQVVKVVQSQIDNLERVYLGELNVVQIRLASVFLETLRQSIAAIAAAYETPANAPSLVDPPTQPSPNRLILKGVQGLICLGILGSLVSLTPRVPGAWMAILLMTVLVGVEVVLQLETRDRAKTSPPLQLPPTSLPVVRIDSKVLLDNLADALQTIDEAIDRAKETNKAIDASGIEELPELLNLIQRLMGASFLNRPQMAIEVAKLLPQVLREQGIRAEIYRPDASESDRNYFDFEPSIDRSAKDSVTVTPALLKGDRVILKGRVIEPIPVEVKDS